MIRFGVIILFLLLFVPVAEAQRTQRRKVPPRPAQPQVTEKEMKELSEAASKSREHLIATSKTYRESLEHLLALHKQNEERTAQSVEKKRQLFEMGLIAKRELEEIEGELDEAKKKTVEIQTQIDSVDHLVAEVQTQEQLAKMPAVSPGSSTGLLIRYVGASRWAMSDINKIDAFFRLKFNRPLPVSAIGHTVTHAQLGFDHHDAIDVALHPDSAEGQDLINFLRSQGISFIAIRGAIAGSATGAHIHIGPASKRIVTQ
ncbi:MAG: coiled-coil domain-containing protein 22 [Acidobacteria bacterium]|nr:coiled-coil domain-containing protein 22 [Acidobacteriota bacterium]